MRTVKLVLPLTLLLVVACDADILSPSRKLSSGASAARSTAGVSLGTATSSASAIVLSWNDNARNETGWEVHQSTTGAAGTFTLRISLPMNSTSHGDTGLNPLTEYCYKVRSFRKLGQNTSYAAFSNISCSTTYGPPLAPSGLNAVPQNSNRVDVSWTDNATTETGYRVERSAASTGPWETAATLGLNATAYFDYSRQPEQPACYRAIAIGAWGESVSNIDCTTPPATPTNVDAVGVDAQSINVSWTDASSVEDGYQVERSDGNVSSVVADLPAGASSYVDVGLTSDTRYWYRVRAKKDGGFSYFSGAASGTTRPTSPPVAPTLTAVPWGSSAATVGFIDYSVSTTSFRVERSTDGQVTWQLVGTMDVDQGGWMNDGDRVTEREVCYRGYAINSLGESPVSNVDCTIPPAFPTNLAQTDNGDGTKTATWTDNSNVEEFYEVWVYVCAYPEWPECWYESYWADPNNTSLVFGSEWYLQSDLVAVYALYDGGYSDPGTWAGGEGLMRVSEPRSSLVDRAKKAKIGIRPSPNSRRSRLPVKPLSSTRMP